MAEENINDILGTDSFENQKSDNLPKKYPALRMISAIYKIFAWIIGIATALIAFNFIRGGETGMLFAILTLIIGGLLVLGVLAIAESIMVFIDIESNTRHGK